MAGIRTVVDARPPLPTRDANINVCEVYQPGIFKNILLVVPEEQPYRTLQTHGLVHRLVGRLLERCVVDQMPSALTVGAALTLVRFFAVEFMRP
jgi:hypothetical protein